MKRIICGYSFNLKKPNMFISKHFLNFDCGAYTIFWSVLIKVLIFAVKENIVVQRVN